MAVFLTDIINNTPNLPSFYSEDSYQLYYDFDEFGIPHGGGYSLIGPITSNKALVIVDSTGMVFGLMTADKDNYTRVLPSNKAELCALVNITVEYFNATITSSSWGINKQ